MKVLFMEKFDGHMSNVDRHLGRDPRFSVSYSGFTTNQFKLDSVNGMDVSYDTRPSRASSGNTLGRRIDLNLSLPTLDPNKRYSIIFKGLSVWYKIWYYYTYRESTTSTIQLSLFGNMLVNSRNSSMGDHSFNSTVLPLAPNEIADVEVVQDGGKLWIYKNDVLTGVVDGIFRTNLIKLYTSSYYYYWSSGYGSWSSAEITTSPFLKLSGLVLVELADDQSRVGTVRLDSSIVSINNDTGKDESNLNSPNYSDGDFLSVGPDDITLRPFDRHLDPSEKLIHSDLRVAMTRDNNQTKALVTVKDGGEVVVEEEFNSLLVGDVHNIYSACNILSIGKSGMSNDLTVTVGPVIPEVVEDGED